MVPDVPLSEDIICSQPPTRRGRQNVFARLQSLLPSSPLIGLSEGNVASPIHSPEALETSPRFLKVRILTWNMNDQMPKGDLEELLGVISPPSLATVQSEPRFPNLSKDTDHPYHIVVIAGQECPSLSGIPMGLGAGFQFGAKGEMRDKEKEKEKENSQSRERDQDYDTPYFRPNSRSDNMRKIGDGPVGWTSIIEDWLCSGGNTTTRQSPVIIVNGDPIKPSHRPSPKQMSPGDIPQRCSGKDQQNGPYQLLIKERMMGIYMAIYINRDIRGLVKGTSRSAVAAGLMKGRVGNKGGVGISINLNGTTILFLNTHLAAHEGKVQHRLANLAKIKTELMVDDFLANSDPRVMAEDITDKFDYTFLCGDLNFRLDISRLHADWLISRQDFAQALAFDELRNLMQRGEAFVGFNEAPINFPPTFKYDVLRTIKSRKKSSKRSSWTTSEKVNRLSEFDENEAQEREDEDGEVDGEVTSIASSAWTSTNSKHGTDVEDKDSFQQAALSPNPLGTSGSAVAAEFTNGVAAVKVKSRWLGLLSPSGPFKNRHSAGALRTPNSNVEISASSADILTNKHFLLDSELNLRTNLLRPSVSASSIKSALVRSDEEGDDEDKGVYDSSYKKRVPSWCDRILWKSTVVPDLENGEPLCRKPRNRIGQFFTGSIWPLFPRGRAISLASISSSDQPEVPSKDRVTERSVPGEMLDSTVPFSRFGYGRSHSIDTMVSASRPPSARPGSPEVLTALLRRSFSVNSNAPSKMPAPSSPAKAASFPPCPRDAPDAPPKDPPLLSPRRASAPSRWRLFPFLSREYPQISEPPVLPPPGKGDIVCLSYNTLDDRGMRRLESRSDHRPVIGSYAIYF